jgi:hypothetical protein
VVEDHAASARRTLVDCSNEVGHALTLAFGTLHEHDRPRRGPPSAGQNNPA